MRNSNYLADILKWQHRLMLKLFEYLNKKLFYSKSFISAMHLKIHHNPHSYYHLTPDPILFLFFSLKVVLMFQKGSQGDLELQMSVL